MFPGLYEGGYVGSGKPYEGNLSLSHYTNIHLENGVTILQIQEILLKILFLLIVLVIDKPSLEKGLLNLYII
jgi:hypothetical protein